MEERDNIRQALLRCAVGYDLSEVVEEYVQQDGEMVLSKRRVSKKSVPPDLKAIRILLDETGERDVSELSDEELESEKRRLLELLKRSESDPD